MVNKPAIEWKNLSTGCLVAMTRGLVFAVRNIGPLPASEVRFLFLSLSHIQNIFYSSQIFIFSVRRLFHLHISMLRVVVLINSVSLLLLSFQIFIHLCSHS